MIYSRSHVDAKIKVMKCSWGVNVGGMIARQDGKPLVDCFNYFGATSCRDVGVWKMSGYNRYKNGYNRL